MPSADPPSTLVVNLDADADARLVDALAAAHPRGAAFARSCAATLRVGTPAGRLAFLRAVLEDADAVSAMAGSVEYAGMLAVWASGLERLPPGEAGGVVAAMAGALAACGENCAQLERARRLEMLATLYNLTPGSPTSPKVPVLILLVRAAVAMGATPDGSHAALHRLADSLLLRAAPLLERWGTPMEQRRELHLAGADALAAAGRSAEGGGLLVAYLATFPDGPAAPEARARATEAVLGGLRDPIGLLGGSAGAPELSTLPPVRDLANYPDSAPLLRLLEIYAEGSLDDLRRLLAETGASAVLAAHRLDPQEAERNMRLLSLCSLAAERSPDGDGGGASVPYAAVAAALRIPEDEVEPWIVGAVRRGLVDAKMDQMERTVVVEKAMVRRFGKEQWADLGNRLKAWRVAVKGVLDGMASEKAVEEPVPVQVVDQ
mmetsp:Transcript_1443/g.3121  ORF Transcript_1443/g.3121 Transcript_1443/m.3121 type:complete len:434 (-) Transcript_1443:73-1374(-)